MTQKGSNLDIDIRDDQIIRSLRACFARPGFIRSIVVFSASGIVVNTLSFNFARGSSRLSSKLTSTHTIQDRSHYHSHLTRKGNKLERNIQRLNEKIEENKKRESFETGVKKGNI